MTGTPFKAGWGLCASCLHAKMVESAKGSRFVLCRLSAADPRFPRYPVVPVLVCEGFSPESARD